jgi:DNA-binding Lrp family transcriptional regulator
MDDLDEKLLALLKRDGRRPAAALAEALGVSRGTVQNRIDRLIEQGTILGFTIELGAEAQSNSVRAIMTIAIEGKHMPMVVRALRSVPQVEAVHSTNGRWDLVAEISAANLAAFGGALDDIRAINGISNTETSLLLTTTRF